MENQRKYEHLKNLDLKLEKFVGDRFYDLKNKYESLKNEVETLEKDFSKKLDSMKKKGFEDTYIYEKYHGEQEDIIESKQEEMNKIENNLSFFDFDKYYNINNFISFLTNAFKVNGDILKDRMSGFSFDNYAKDLLTSIFSKEKNVDMKKWNKQIKCIEHEYNCKINCFNLTGKSKCSLNDFIRFNGLNKDIINENKIDSDSFLELLNSIDPPYDKDYVKVYGIQPDSDLEKSFLISFLFRNINNKEVLKNYSFNLSINAKLCFEEGVYPSDAVFVLDQLNTSVIKAIIDSNSCKEILGDLFDLVNKKYNEDQSIDYSDILKEDKEVKKIIDQINQKYSINKGVNKNEPATYIDEDSKIKTGQEYPGSGEGGRGVK